MPDIREIRNHMKGVRDTEKITQAMHMIALSKMRKARNALDITRPYFDAIRIEIYRLFKNSEMTDSIYIQDTDAYLENIRGGTAATKGASSNSGATVANKKITDSEKRGIVVITSNKGLAGNYNHAVVREAERLIDEAEKASEHVELFLIGEYGRRYFTPRTRKPADENIDAPRTSQAANEDAAGLVTIADDFAYSPDDPNLETSNKIAMRLLDEFDSGRLSVIKIVYTDMVNSMVQTVDSDVILPFAKEDEKYVAELHSAGADVRDKATADGFTTTEVSGSQRADGFTATGSQKSDHDSSTNGNEKNTREKNFPVIDRYLHPTEYYPNAETVLRNTIKAYMTGYIYGAMVDSFCSEQNARMNAMDEANHNAEEIMNSLNLQYNHARQGKITQEITEISSGARALRKKKVK